MDDTDVHMLSRCFIVLINLFGPGLYTGQERYRLSIAERCLESSWRGSSFALERVEEVIESCAVQKGCMRFT